MLDRFCHFWEGHFFEVIKSVFEREIDNYNQQRFL